MSDPSRWLAGFPDPTAELRAAAAAPEMVCVSVPNSIEGERRSRVLLAVESVLHAGAELEQLGMRALAVVIDRAFPVYTAPKIPPGVLLEGLVVSEHGQVSYRDDHAERDPGSDPPLAVWKMLTALAKVDLGTLGLDSLVFVLYRLRDQ